MKEFLSHRDKFYSVCIFLEKIYTYTNHFLHIIICAESGAFISEVIVYYILFIVSASVHESSLTALFPNIHFICFPNLAILPTVAEVGDEELN